MNKTQIAAVRRLSTLLGIIPADMSRMSNEDALDTFRALRSICHDLGGDRPYGYESMSDEEFKKTDAYVEG